MDSEKQSDIPNPPIEMSDLSKEEMDDCLGKLAETIDSFFYYNFGKNMDLL